MADFTMPSLGSDMEAGELVEWLVKPGDEVKRGDIVAVVETAKGAIDIEIFQSGKILELVVPVGEKVPVGAVLARVQGDDEPAAKTDEPGPATEATAPSPTPAAPVAVAAPDQDHVRAVPRARRRARELGLDLAAIRGSGPGGAITVTDVEAAATGRKQDMRGAIAAAMSRANREIPHYHLSHAVDLEPAMAWLGSENQRRSVTERLLPVVLLVRATALALRKYPQLNGHWLDGRFVPADTVALGIAVSLKGGGLVAPAMANTADLSLDDTMASLRDLIARARANNLRSSEMHGGTATLTNLGDLGVDIVHGIIHHPQVALIGFGAIAERPWVVDGAVVPRRVVQVSLSADHRATDGHLGGKFLLAIDQLLQKPEQL